MGIGFVILIHLIAILIVSFVIAVPASIITYFVGKKEKRKRKVFVAFTAPFVGLYTLYICGLIGASIVSEVKKVDIGIGDSWYVPLENNRQLLFIDLPEQAYIAKENGQILISEVSAIDEVGSLVFGKTDDHKYFSYDTKTDEVKNFDTEKELRISNSKKEFKLQNAYDYYSDKKGEIADYWLLLVGLISLMISIGVVYILKQIVFVSFTGVR
jgi:hypothetical protein